jgi:hypothetical protein
VIPTIPEVDLIPDLRLLDIVLWTSQDDRIVDRRRSQGPRWLERPIGERVPLDDVVPVPVG